MERKSFKDFIAFKFMITPVFIQVIFWLGVLSVFAAGIFSMTRGGVGALMGILIWIFGALYVRVICEIMIIFFRIYETLKDIRNNIVSGWQSGKLFPAGEETTSTGDSHEHGQKLCPECGKFVNQGMKYCNHCGSPLE